MRVPRDLFDALLRLRLSGIAWAIVLWVIRQTFGWNRHATAFTWYRVAKELQADRAAVYRAGKRLVAGGLLLEDAEQLRIAIPKTQTVVPEQLRIKHPGDAEKQRSGNKTVAHRQRFSVDLKTVQLKDKRRRSGGQCGYLASEAVQELLNYYGAFIGTPLEGKQRNRFEERFGSSAKALLEAFQQDVEAAKSALKTVVEFKNDGPRGPLERREPCFLSAPARRRRQPAIQEEPSPRIPPQERGSAD